MLAQLLLGFERRRSFWLVLAPVDLAVFKIVQVDLADWGLLVTQRVFGVLAPMVGGADDDAMGKRFLARGGEEAINVAFL